MDTTRRKFLANLSAVGALTISPAALMSGAHNSGPRARSNTDWFRDAKWGVFCFNTDLGESKMSALDWNRHVDAFDTRTLGEQLKSVGANYLIFCLAQNSGHFYSPNETYDSIVGIQPSKCSRRDLIHDLSEALLPHGIKLLVYLPSGAPGADPVAVKKLQWEWGIEGKGSLTKGGKHTGKRLAEFQRMWESVIREWSDRWGKRVSGWWIDGCYFADEMYRHPDPPNFESFASALKAGNPSSIVAFNPGVFVDFGLREVISLTEYEDYTAGEVARAFPVCPGRWVNGAQYHVLSFLGESWGLGEPRFADEFVTGYTKDVVSKGGVVSWDVPINKDGSIPAKFLAQLKNINNAL